MSKEVKNNIITNVLTAVLTIVITSFGLFMKEEFNTYNEMKEALPEIKEINKVKAKMENEYKANKQKTASEIWKIKEEIKNLNLDKKELSTIKHNVNKIRRIQKRDSSYIYWSYKKCYDWSQSE